MSSPITIKDQPGQTTVAVILIILSISLVIVTSRVKLIMNYQLINRNTIKSMETYYTAEAGIEDSLLRLVKTHLTYAATNTLTLNGGSATVEITENGDDKRVVVQGQIGNRIRKLEVNLVTSDSGDANFKYGAQIGAGGLLMENNSKIIGNVYSGGDIIAGIGSPEITGDAWAAGTSTISGFDDLGIGVDAHASDIQDSLIGRDAYYQTISGSTVVGNSYPGSPNPQQVEMPIPATRIAGWKVEAESGGVISGDYVLDSSATDSLGPKKIEGNMTITGKAVLTITGMLWVTGNVSLDFNFSAIELDSAYGDTSGVLISDSVITVANSFYICGSEGYDIASKACYAPTDSYLLLLSTYSGDPAIDMANGSALRAVLYTSSGTLSITNNATVVEATAYAMTIQNNVEVVYESGLINTSFSAGPGGSWEIMNWREIE